MQLIQGKISTVNYTEKLKIVNVFDREEFVEKVFEMEAEYMDQFGLEEVVENKNTGLDKWLKDFNSNEQREAFIDNGDIPF